MLFSRKDLTKLLIPLLIEQMLAVAVGMADVVMVAAVGEAAVSGVSLVDSISLLINQLLAALATAARSLESEKAKSSHSMPAASSVSVTTCTWYTEFGSAEQ